jgi:hypothetical protein
MNWIELAQDTSKWRAVVKTVLNLLVCKEGCFFTGRVNITSSMKTLHHGIDWFLRIKFLLFSD